VDSVIPGTVYQLFNDPNGCAGIQFFNGKNCKSSGSRHAPSCHSAGEEAPADLKLMNVDPLLSIIYDDGQKFLTGRVLQEKMEGIHKHKRTDRTLGSTTFFDQPEVRLGSILKL
jgi:hypothetical protein